MKLTLGISPCPNDTFIFDALVNEKIDTKEYQFDLVMEDVETLNQWALEAKLDISKISYGVWPLLMNQYNLLESGGALGKGVGPLLISNLGFQVSNLQDSIVALPGEHTTAHLLFSLAFPDIKNKIFIPFHEIEEFVLKEKSNEKRAGVIIHENRFTYQQKGLVKILDLGDYWEQKTKLPIPLGGIVARKDLDKKVTADVDALIKKSLEYAFENYKKTLPSFVKRNAQEMHEDVMWQHINLYVNNFSLSLGETGKKAVNSLTQVFQQISLG